MAGKYRYEVVIYCSDQDQAFIAEVPELTGCAVDGATYQEVIANVESVIQEWIETAQELGRSVPPQRATGLCIVSPVLIQTVDKTGTYNWHTTGTCSGKSKESCLVMPGRERLLFRLGRRGGALGTLDGLGDPAIRRRLETALADLAPRPGGMWKS